MKHNYSYDEIYGTLLHKNENDTERVYFIIECHKYQFLRWMYQHNWNKVKEKHYERNGLRGFKITIKQSH